ncbi:MAG: hypothetical protein ABIP66_20745 [Gemmatimonadaceae bacterium]
MKSITIDQDIFDFLASKATSPGETAATVLRRALRIPQPQVALEVDDQTFAFIAAGSSTIGESASAILRRQLGLSPEPPTPLPPAPPSPGQGPAPSSAVVIFTIPAGAGSLAWNTRETAVSASVGDTLRIINNDAVSHRLHTSGRPFPHPATDIPPGQAVDLVLQATFSPDADGPLTDHAQGSQGLFWLSVAARQ